MHCTHFTPYILFVRSFADIHQFQFVSDFHFRDLITFFSPTLYSSSLYLSASASSSSSSSLDFCSILLNIATHSHIYFYRFIHFCCKAKILRTLCNEIEKEEKLTEHFTEICISNKIENFI